MANMNGIFVIQFFCLAILAKGAPVKEGSSSLDGSHVSRRSFFLQKLEDKRMKRSDSFKHEGKRSMAEGSDGLTSEVHYPTHREVPSKEMREDPVEEPDFFKLTADKVAEQLKQQLTNTMLGEMYRGRTKRAEGEGEEEENEDSLRPEMHFSTLRAQASGSVLPGPTMFVGGFSFMMMPSPDGEAVFSKIMENLPNLQSGGK